MIAAASLARIAGLSTLVLFLAGCATRPGVPPTDRLESYRAAAGEPQRSFTYRGRLWGWTSLGGETLAVWTHSDRGFLLEVARPCQDLAFAVYITLTSRQGRVVSGADSIIARRIDGGIGGSRCRIESIRPLDARAVRESQRDLREGEVADTPVAEST
jgi:hypothetical protein